MDVITSIRKERGKFRVTLNGDSDVLVPVSLFHERPLTEGDPIDGEEYDQWLMVRQFRYAMDRAVAFMATRARSRKEIETKLLQTGYRPCTVEMVLYKLEKEQLLDDADFARQWVEARSNRRLGSHRIAMELRQKGVSAEEAEAAMAALSDETQLADAIALASKSYARAKPGEEPRKVRARISGQLARRGYGWDIIKEALQEAMAEDEDE